VTGQALAGPEYFPELAPAGDVAAQAFVGDPRAGSDRVRLMYLKAFASARRSIRMSMAYFIPCDLTLQELIAARERGVAVEIILPGREMDSPPVRPASRAKWGKLLKAGARIYEYEPAMYHCKGLIVDEVWSSGGSANLDPRSFVTTTRPTSTCFPPDSRPSRSGSLRRTRRGARGDLRRVETSLVRQRLMEWLTAPFVPLL